MEEKRHISDFKVENFKRFDSFEMKNIGQFNLIVGNNNIGKTSVLEALLLDWDVNKLMRNLSLALEERDLLYTSVDQNPSKIFNQYLNKKREGSVIFSKMSLDNGHTNDNYTSAYRILNKSEVDLSKEGLRNKILLNPNKNQLVEIIVKDDFIHDEDNRYNFIEEIDFSSVADNLEYVPFISIKGGYIEDLADYYSQFILPSNNLKKKLVEDIQLFEPHIWDIELTDDEYSIIVRHIDYDAPLPITQLGEGVVKFAKILIGIIIQKGKSLMIDEIDAGIYHGRFKKFWKTILLSARKNNVQLFATTHSQECLKFIKEVLEEDEELKSFQKDMRCFRLVEQKDKSVKSYCYDYEKFQFAIDHENEIR